MKTNLTKLALLGLLALAACKKNQLTAGNNEAAGTVSPGLKTATITTTYYVDDTGGNDAHDGKTPATAWKTVSKVNSTTFTAGNQILFKAGGSWTNRLHPLGSGTSGSPIVISKYVVSGGSTANPKINGGGTNQSAVYLYNQKYWEINNLEVTNYSSTDEGGQALSAWETANAAFAVSASPAQKTNTNHKRYGVYIQAQDAGQVDHVYLHNLVVHGVDGAIGNQDSTKSNGGIVYQITGSVTSTHWNDILIDSCTIHDTDGIGLTFISSWGNRSGGFDPSTGVIIRSNFFQYSGANALIVRVTDHALVDKNTFDHCAIKFTGNAAFCFDTDFTKFQNNECRYTRANTGDADAGGIDADYNTNNTIIQYNYLHDNDYGMLITGGGGGSAGATFNNHTQVKYNIIERDGTVAQAGKGKYCIKVSGGSHGTMIYNNIIYISSAQTSTQVVYHWKWDTEDPDSTSYYNNIVDNNGTSTTYTLNTSSHNVFDYNAFYHTAATSQPSQTHAITGDIKFVSAGSAPSGFKIQSTSAAIDAGKLISGNGGKDYFGTTVSQTLPPNVGIDNTFN